MKFQRIIRFLLLAGLHSLSSMQAVSSPALKLPQLQATQPTKADEILRQGFEFYEAQQFSSALNSFKQALLLYRQTSNWSGQGQALGALGAVYIATGDYTNAVHTSQQQLNLTQLHSDPGLLAQAWGNLGIAYNELGDYPKATYAHQQALDEMRRQKNQRGEGQVLGNLANTYMSLGEYELVEATYQQSLKIAKAQQDQDGELAALVNLGVLYTNEKADYKKAIDFYKQALRIADKGKKKIEKASILINLGSAYHAQANGDAAKLNQVIYHYQQGFDIAKSIPNSRLQAEALGSLAIAYEDRGNYQRAIDYQKQSLAIANSLKHPGLEAVALNNMAHILLTAGKQTKDRSKLKESEMFLRQALKLRDEARKELQDGQSISMFDTQAHSYNLLQQVMIELGEIEPALEASEWGRSRAFINLLARRLNANSQIAHDAKPPNSSQIRQIAKQQNSTLVEYSIIPDDQFKFRGKLQGPEATVYVWVVKPTGEIAFRTIDLTSNNIDLRRLVFDSREAIGAGDRASLKPVLTPELLKQQKEHQTKNLKQLYKLLIEPITDLLPTDSSDRVIFIPQGELFLVPFPALLDTNGRFLIEKHTVLTVPSIQVLELTRQQRQKQTVGNKEQEIGNALVVGNPVMPTIYIPTQDKRLQLADLPGAAQEAKNIAAILKTQPLIGAQARKSTVTAQMSNAHLIHLATHGLLDDLKGIGVPGAIALAPDGSQQDNDGLLTANEILDMKLSAELVVLSACDTGRGQITGDGVIGLSRSLISAGVPSVIVSLWKVPDESTALLMTEFYKHLQKSSDKAQALQQAMLITKQQYSNPLNWAAFTLIGEAE